MQRRFAAVISAVVPVGVLVTVHLSVYGTVHMAIGYILAWSEEETEELETWHTVVRFGKSRRAQVVDWTSTRHVTMEMF